MGRLDAGKKSPSGKGGKGLVGKALSPLAKIGGAAIEALSAPQQIVYRTGSALGELGQGNLGGFASELGHAGLEAATLGQAKGNIGFSEAATPLKQREQGMVRKLPTGLETAANIAFDPLNFLTAGTGSEARQGFSALARLTPFGETTAAGVKAAAREVGGKELIQNFGRERVKEAIAKDIYDNSGEAAKILDKQGAKAAIEHASTQAEKLINAVEKRGGGGIGLHIPGTDVQKTLVSGGRLAAAKSALAESKLGEVVGKAAEAAHLPQATEAVRKGLEPGYKLGKRIGGEASAKLRSLGSKSVAAQEATRDNILAELRAGVQASEKLKGEAINSAEDALVLKALQSGVHEREALMDLHPHLEPVITALDRIRRITGDEQVAAKILKASSLHDAESYASRILTPEMEKVVKSRPNLAGEAASRVGGSLKGALSPGSNRMRKLFPDMPDSLVNELVERSQNGEDIRALLEDPRYDDYIGVGQKAKAQEMLEKQIENIKAKPITTVSPEQLKAEAAQHAKDADQIIADAIEAGDEEIVIKNATGGSNVYMTPQTAEQHEALKKVLDDLTMSQKIDVNGSNWSNGVAQAINDTAATHLPPDIQQSRTIFLGNSPPENRLPHFNKFMEWVTGGSPEAEAYTKELQKRLKDLGYTDEIYVFRGFNSGNSSAQYANVSTLYHVGQSFSSHNSMPRIYKVKLSDILAAAHEGEGELIVDATKLHQIHADSLKDLRLPKDPGQMFTYKKGNIGDLTPGDKFRYNDHSQVFHYVGPSAKGPDWISVEYMGVNSPVIKNVPVKSTVPVEIVTGLDTHVVGSSSPISAAAKASMKAHNADEAKTLMMLAGHKTLLAEQLLTDGALTADQAAKQIDAAINLAAINGDTRHLKDTLANQLKLVAQALPPGGKVYEESALASVLKKGNEAARAVEAAHYVQGARGITDSAGEKILLSADDLKTVSGKPIPPPKGWVKFDLPVLGEFHAPAEVAEEMQRVTGYIMQNESVKGFDKFMKNWMQFWKTHATVGLAGALPFGTRNARSNLFLMAAGGMGPDDLVRNLGDALKFQRKIREVIASGKYADEIAHEGLDPVLRKLLKPEDYKLYREAQNRGIITQGFFDFDFDTDLSEQVRKLGIDTGEGKKHIVKRATKAVVSHKGTVATKGREFNSAIEHNARLAAFMWAMDRTGNVEQAADMVKGMLFDYSDLTPLEQKRLKNIVPFYTFMRKNVPLQFRTLIENPQRILAPEKVSQAFTEGLPEEAPDYQREAGARQIRQGIPLIGGLVTTPDRPIYSAFDPFAPLVAAAQGKKAEAARGLVNLPGGPQVTLGKNLIELGTGKDTFTGGAVKPGAAAAAQRLLGGQVPSLGRLPRVELPGKMSPTRALTGKQAKPTASETLKLLTGVRAERPKS